MVIYSLLDDLEQTFAGASASKYLRIKLNGIFYKIVLLAEADK